MAENRPGEVSGSFSLLVIKNIKATAGAGENPRGTRPALPLEQALEQHPVLPGGGQHFTPARDRVPAETRPLIRSLKTEPELPDCSPKRVAQAAKHLRPSWHGGPRPAASTEPLCARRRRLRNVLKTRRDKCIVQVRFVYGKMVHNSPTALI